MAQPPNRREDDERIRDEDLGRGIGDEDVTGRAADEEEFEELDEDEEEEDEEDESLR